MIPGLLIGFIVSLAVGVFAWACCCLATVGASSVGNKRTDVGASSSTSWRHGLLAPSSGKVAVNVDGWFGDLSRAQCCGLILSVRVCGKFHFRVEPLKRMLSACIFLKLARAKLRPF